MNRLLDKIEHDNMLKISKIIFFFALVISFIVRLIFKDFYHYFDVNTFVSWGQYISPLKNVYASECFCNYPIFGMLYSTGLLKLFDYNIQTFLFFLSFIDAVNVILIWIIFKILKTPFAMFWSGLVGVLLSSWVGGALWGQIDNIGQLFVLITAILILLFIKMNRFESKGINLLILPIGFSILHLLLIKQLLIFAIIPIAIFLLFYIYFSSTIIQFFTYILTIILCFFLPLFVIDWWLNIPVEFHFSHLEKIFSEGSKHIDSISGNGFNIWLFFLNDQNLSSNKVIFGIFSPKLLGIILFFGFFIFSICKIYLILKDSIKNKNHAILFPVFFGFFAWFNLMFNLFLTGTHERYLYHFYPYIIIFIVYMFYYSKYNFKFNNYFLFYVLFTSFTYGIFVFCVMRKYLENLWFHDFLFVLHFLLFVYFTIYFFKSFSKLIKE